MILRQKLSRTVYLQYKRVFAGAGRVSATQLSITPDSTFLQNSVDAARVLQGANEGACARGRDAGKVRAVPRYEAKKLEPMIGIEPMTCSLRVSCSTD